MHPPTFAISLRPEPYGSACPRRAVAPAEAELVERNGNLDGEVGLIAATFDPPTGTFLVTRIEGRAGRRRRAAADRRDRAGRGPSTVPRPRVGDRGVGRDLMARIDDAVHEFGLSVLRIEPGDRQPESVSLHLGPGWGRGFVALEGAALPAGWIGFRKVVG